MEVKLTYNEIMERIDNAHYNLRTVLNAKDDPALILRDARRYQEDLDAGLEELKHYQKECTHDYEQYYRPEEDAYYCARCGSIVPMRALWIQSTTKK